MWHLKFNLMKTFRFEELFRQMWISNGNELSKMYAGTAALQGGSKVLKGF
jgi:hypothetical protein